MTDCYCCTCDYDKVGDQINWDPACRKHGAHGQRECIRHGIAGKLCDCGCGYTYISNPKRLDEEDLKEIEDHLEHFSIDLLQGFVRLLLHEVRELKKDVRFETNL